MWLRDFLPEFVPTARIPGLAVVRPVRPEACPGLDYGR